jgi:hypothetical protein
MERVFGPITLRIEHTHCVGFGEIIEEPADVLEMTDEGKVSLRTYAPSGVPRERHVAAITTSPVDALSLHDDEGRQVAP